MTGAAEPGAPRTTLMSREAATHGDGLPPLREVIETYGLAPQKRLGQNFLLDMNLTRKIARLGFDGLAPDQSITVVEIGPGPGGLTRALLAEGATRVVAVERDAQCLPALADIQNAYAGRLHVHGGDALAINAGELVANAEANGDGATTVLVANLPYNIATPLLTGWVESAVWPPWYAQMTLMFQREVAERIVAAPGTKVYGRLAVLCQWRCTCEIVMALPPRAFTPPPKVESAVVRLRPRPNPMPDCKPAALSSVTRSAFGQRRKMLRSSLRALFPDVERVLESEGIAPTSRAEEVPVEGFARLALRLDGDR